MLSPLPIDALLPQLCDALRQHPNVVVEAPPGAGKTTRVPRALLDAGFPQLIMLEPRRVAARAAARRIASELGEPVGQTIGYQVRFDRQRSRATRLLVATEGVLLRRLVDDPFLSGTDVVLLDEVHERSLDADLSLALLRRVQQEVRPELRIVAMSATADTHRIARFLGDAPVLRSEGRAFPVDLRWATRPESRSTAEAAAHTALRALDATDGDVLVFLPGAREIHDTLDLLQAQLPRGVSALPLHGRLPPEAQDAALQPGQGRRVICATNVAETSVTLPGVTAVVDTGLVRQMHHDAATGLDRLLTVPISQASATQRAGRAGRVAPGVCFRLWTQDAHRQRLDHDVPEVQRTDLAGPLLTLAAFGEPDLRRFPWVDPPKAEAIDAAIDLLHRLGALDGSGLTAFGQRIAALPLHPRQAAALLHAAEHGDLTRAARAIALLSERAPLRRVQPPRLASASDLDDQLDALDRDGAHGWQHTGPLRHVFQAARQLEALARSQTPRRGGAQPLANSLRVGWPDRVAVRRDPTNPDDLRLHLANGRGALLHRHSAVRASPCLLALDLTDTGDGDPAVRLAAALDPADLPHTGEVIATYDPERDRVIGARVRRYEALTLHRQEGVQVPQREALEALRDAGRTLPHRAVPTAEPFTHTLERLRWLHAHKPQLDLPPTDPESLVDALCDARPNARSLADLSTCGPDVLLDRLTWPQRQQLDTLAPARFKAPGGRSYRISYPPQGPPVLAVPMQQLFGLTRTPTVAGATVTLHLLAPNGRVQQVTDDLPGFWTRTWPEIRKELRGRYPKHKWPEDPLEG